MPQPKFRPKERAGQPDAAKPASRTSHALPFAPPPPSPSLPIHPLIPKPQTPLFIYSSTALSASGAPLFWTLSFGDSPVGDPVIAKGKTKSPSQFSAPPHFLPPTKRSRDLEELPITASIHSASSSCSSFNCARSQWIPPWKSIRRGRPNLTTSRR